MPILNLNHMFFPQPYLPPTCFSPIERCFFFRFFFLLFFCLLVSFSWFLLCFLVGSQCWGYSVCNSVMLGSSSPKILSAQLPPEAKGRVSNRGVWANMETELQNFFPSFISRSRNDKTPSGTNIFVLSSVWAQGHSILAPLFSGNNRLTSGVTDGD